MNSKSKVWWSPWTSQWLNGSVNHEQYSLAMWSDFWIERQHFSVRVHLRLTKSFYNKHKRNSIRIYVSVANIKIQIMIGNRNPNSLALQRSTRSFWRKEDVPSMVLSNVPDRRRLGTQVVHSGWTWTQCKKAGFGGGLHQSQRSSPGHMVQSTYCRERM